MNGVDGRQWTYGHGACSPFCSEFGNEFMGIRFAVGNSGSLFVSIFTSRLHEKRVEIGVREGHTNLTVNGTIISIYFMSSTIERDSLSPRALFIPTKIFPNRP